MLRASTPWGVLHRSTEHWAVGNRMACGICSNICRGTRPAPPPPAPARGWCSSARSVSANCRVCSNPPRTAQTSYLQQWQVGLFEREGQRWMTASTTACASGHGGVVAASNPALLTYTRRRRAQAACTPRVYCICLPTEPTRVPRHSPARRTIPIISFYIMAGNFRSDFTPPPSTPSSTRCFEALIHRGLYGPVAAGATACPRTGEEPDPRATIAKWQT